MCNGSRAIHVRIAAVDEWSLLQRNVFVASKRTLLSSGDGKLAESSFLPVSGFGKESYEVREPAHLACSSTTVLQCDLDDNIRSARAKVNCNLDFGE